MKLGIHESVTLLYMPNLGVRRLHIGYTDGVFNLCEAQDQSDLVIGAMILIGAIEDDPLVPCFDEAEMVRRNLAARSAKQKET